VPWAENRLLKLPRLGQVKVLKGLFTLLLQPGNAIAAMAGLISIGMTVVVITSGTEIVVEERAEAIIRQSNDGIRPQYEKAIQDLENEKQTLESKLADVIWNNDPEQCDNNPTAKICVYLQNTLEKQTRELEANCDKRVTLSDGDAKNDFNKRLAALRQSLNQQCKTSLLDQETKLTADCDQKIARQRGDLEKEWAAKMQQALADQNKKHAAELAAQKEKLDSEWAAKMRQVVAGQDKKHAAEIAAQKKKLDRAWDAKMRRALADLKKKHSAELAILQRRYDALKKNCQYDIK